MVESYYINTPVKDLWVTPKFQLKSQTGNPNEAPRVGERFSFEYPLQLPIGNCMVIIAIQVTQINLKAGVLIFKYLDPSPVSGEQWVTLQRDRLITGKEITRVEVTTMVQPRSLAVRFFYPYLHREIVDGIHKTVKRYLESLKSSK
jgi:hypothetical protein